LAKVLVFMVMEVGALCGVPMTPKQIEELMQTLNKTHHEQVLKNENDDGKDPEGRVTRPSSGRGDHRDRGRGSS